MPTVESDQSAVEAFEHDVVCKLRHIVEMLDGIASNPMLGKRYAWESLHCFPLSTSLRGFVKSLAKWQDIAKAMGFDNIQEFMDSHAELKQLNTKLQEYENWGNS